METVIFVSVFVWFLFMNPPVQESVQPYKPPMKAQSTKYQSSVSTKTKLKSFITKNNPKIDSKEADDIAYYIDEYATKENVDPMLVAALISRESSFQKKAVSKTGAKGLGQIKDFNFESLDISDPFDVKQNVRGTVKYIKHLTSMWKDSVDQNRLVLASYYQGPNKTKKTKDNMASHVHRYVDDILARYKDLKNR